MPVNLCFRASNRVNADLTALAHLVGPDGEIASGSDQPLAEGRFPTRRWREGDASTGTWAVALPSHACLHTRGQTP